MSGGKTKANKLVGMVSHGTTNLLLKRFYTKGKLLGASFIFPKTILWSTGHLFFPLFSISPSLSLSQCERASKCGPRQNPEAERI